MKTLTIDEQWNSLLHDEIHEREAQYIDEIAKEWDKLYGRLPSYSDYVKIRLVQKWLEFAILN